MQKYDDFRIEPFVFQYKSFYVKRDELLKPLLSGNKYWKLYDLIHTPKERYRKLISYGGTQSNAMLSMAALCHQKGWEFHYTCKPVPRHLREQPMGNLKLALDMGMVLHEVAHDAYAQRVAYLREHREAGSLFVPQGGADAIARRGVAKLADEIRQWQQAKGFEKLTVVTPSGTGTTAFYLAQSLPDCAVLTTAVVGDQAYLQTQMKMLGKIPDNLVILQSEKKFHFAKPYPELLEIYRALLDAGLTFDLIYAPVMWRALCRQQIQGAVLYVHSGGLLGNASMLERYRHSGML